MRWTQILKRELMPAGRSAWHFLLLMQCILLLSACAQPLRQHAAPVADDYARAHINGMHDERFWGDQPAPYLDNAVARLTKSLQNNPQLYERMDILALSGGAEDGAYGAGFLKGWSERGDRPEFQMVTGISTGALIAPFAFLGPAYDDAIERLFTDTSRRGIFF